MSLAPYVRILGRGPGRSRSLTQDEASEAMRLIFTGKAAPEALGALLMLMRMKGETAEEIAGFAQVAQESLSGMPRADLDWPSYAAGRTRGLPWFLLSARLVAQAGHSVVLHGMNGPDAAVRDGLRFAGIKTAETATDARKLLSRDGLVYLPLERLSPKLFRLLDLRGTFGLRSCINTVCRMLNPARAAASVQGVFHPPYRLLQSDAAGLMGWQSLSVIKGGGGEFERNPAKAVAGFGLRGGAPWEQDFAPLMDSPRRLDDGARDLSLLRDMWAGSYSDPFAEAIVTGTATLALDTLGSETPHEQARTLWATRDRALVV